MSKKGISGIGTIGLQRLHDVRVDRTYYEITVDSGVVADICLRNGIPVLEIFRRAESMIVDAQSFLDVLGKAIASLLSGDRI